MVAAKTKEYGSADPALTGTLTGFLVADGVTAAYSRAAGETVLGGPYAITAVLSPAGVLSNYNITNTPSALTISARPITITADAKFKCFESLDPALTAQVTAGTIVFGNLATGSLVRAAGETAGTYLISKGTYTYGSNYAETYIAANFVINPSIVAATFNTNNSYLYFGYTGDQTATITAKPSGGVGPYTVKISMNRPLKCNYINDAGDEKWMPAGVSSSANNTCTGITYPSIIPLTSVTSTTWTGVLSSTTVSLNVTLMQDAIFTLEITDASGCVYTKTGFLTGGNVNGNIDAEDVRCFAGNSSIVKVTLCHRTGSTKNPCVTLCVDENAVADHMAHGDFMGNCTSNCIAPVANAKVVPVLTSSTSGRLEATVMPNPTTNHFNLVIKGKDASPVTVRVMDVYGKVVMVNQKIGSYTTLRIGDNWTNGTYLVEVIQGNQRKLLKLIKAN